MKYFFLTAVVVALVALALVNVQNSSASVAVSNTLVISQLQGGGATADDEFIEIHNVSAAPYDLNGHRVVYRSATGSTDVGPMAQWTTSTIIPAGGYYLIAATSYDGSPAADITYSPSTCACSMSATQGGVAIKNSGGTILDSLGYGAATNAFVEGAAGPSPGNNNSAIRKLGGCQDTDSNSNDFVLQTPSAPRSSATAAFQCASSGENLFASIAANPTSVVPGGNVLLTITVTPATTPPSTSITASANLQPIGGAASQPFFDNGTNGDVTAGDNVFSYLATVAPSSTGGIVPIAGSATDLQARVAPVQLSLTINAPQANEDPLVLGNPSKATADIANENNYLMVKPQYTLSYDRSEATPNWVAWRLDTVWIGNPPVSRQDDFRPDPSLPAGWYQVTDGDYSGSGYTRGHMTPSGDRTNTIPNNSATFLMTNMVPQLAANNTGPWEDLESYCRTLANQGNELYIISGPSGNIGTIGDTANRIVVPAVTWKVVMVLPNGTNDLQRVRKSTRVFGVIMSNSSISQSAPWRNFRVTVNAVEALTGYDFFSAVPRGTQEIMERQRDRL